VVDLDRTGGQGGDPFDRHGGRVIHRGGDPDAAARTTGGGERAGAAPAAIAASVSGPADLLRALAEDPEALTPALARALKERVDEVYRDDARAARRLAACVRIVAERCGDLGSAALAHRAQALAALAAGRQREVLRHYEAAERLYDQIGDEIERARVLRSMIDPLMHLGRYDEAIAAGNSARATFLERGFVLLAAQVDANIGNVHHHLDRHAESLDAYDRALATFRAAGDDAAAATVEFNRAHAFLARGELASAERDYRRALGTFQERGWRLNESQCRYALAHLAFVAGRSGEALRQLDRVREVDRELGDERHAALCSLDEAELLLALNAWEDARGRAGEAQTALTGLGLTQEATVATLFLGLGAIHLRRWDEAELRLDEAARGFAADGNVVLAALADLYRAELRLRRGAPKAAVGLAWRAARAFEERGLAAKAAYALVVTGRALAAAGKKRTARRLALDALDRLERVPSSGIGWRARALLAEVAADPAERRARLEEAVAEVEALRSPVLPDELQAAFQRDKAELYGALAMARLAGEGGSPDLAGALAAVEAAKARALADRLHGVRDTGHGARSGPRERARRRRIEELNYWYRRLNEAERGEAPRAAAEPIRREIAHREAEIASLSRAAQLERSTVAADESGRVTPGAGPRATARSLLAPASGAILLSDLATVLDAGEALVEYAMLDDELHAFVVVDGHLTHVGPFASRASVAEAIERWLFQAEKTTLGADYLESHAGSLAEVARRVLGHLHALVWAPLAQALEGVTAVVVVPAGPLAYAPFHALWEGDRFVVERTLISIAPSASALVSLRRRPPTHGGGALVLGYEIPGLPAIGLEVESVRRWFPEADLRVGQRATRAALRRHGARAGIVHLAAHADYRSDSPLLSSIELADGRLTFYDLFDLRLSADLVVLSGCRTGRQRWLEGDELLGLARGFQVAGARDLVASLWPVDDRATARFMDRFYERLAEGGGARAALRGAMMELIEAGRPPHEWAAFHLSGSGARGSD
jgi:CHAT domain-containing protein/tetratricopeptide (TPR) repeat protein